jgi:hypothetical protein
LVDLGDKRRTDRLVKVAQGLAKSPGRSIPQAMEEWSQTKAAYRLLSDVGITPKALLEPHILRMREMVREPGSEWVFIEDWTQLDYSGRQAEGLGQIGNEAGRGLLAHTCLILRVLAWNDSAPQVVPTGLLGQKIWTRDPQAIEERKNEDWRDRLKRDRESQHWGEAVTRAGRNS